MARTPTPRALAGELVVMLLIGLILAAIGPFGSFALGGFGARFAYWLPASFLGYAIFRPLSLIVLLAGERLGLSEIAALPVAIIVAAFPATAAILWLGGMRTDSSIRLDDLLQLYFQVALIGGVIGLFFVLLSRDEKAPPPAPPQAKAVEAEPVPPFVDRLPPSWNGQFTALEMEDHYVRAHGPDGASTLILMRMADAERELADADGSRVHRSWWVMRDKVTNTRRDGRALRLELAGGLTAPVARDRVADLKAAGWPL